MFGANILLVKGKDTTEAKDWPLSSNQLSFGYDGGGGVDFWFNSIYSYLSFRCRNNDFNVLEQRNNCNES